MINGFHGGFGGFGGLQMLWMLGGLLIFLLLLAGFIFLVVMAARRGGRPGPYFAPPPTGVLTAKEILQARFAKGEITREQYREMLAEIDH